MAVLVYNGWACLMYPMAMPNPTNAKIATIHHWRRIGLRSEGSGSSGGNAGACCGTWSPDGSMFAFETSEGGHAIMDQRNETFVPHVLAITTGTTVDFPNSDKFYHNVFSLSKTKTFDLGRYAAGRARQVRFDRPGIVRVFCDIHSHMNAFILVFSHPFFALTDADGRYRIENVPAGTYGVVAWNEGASSETKSVTVPDGGVAELDFTIR